MLIARDKKKNNIAEYILYMWQLEDLFRALHLNIDEVDKSIVQNYKVDDATKKQIYDWYDNLINMMNKENLTKSGHLQVIMNTVNELTELHFYLMQKLHDNRYNQIVSMAVSSLIEFRGRSKVGNDVSDVELALNALYGNLLLKLQHKEISPQTTLAMESFSRMLAYLSTVYKKMDEEEDRSFIES